MTKTTQITCDGCGGDLTYTGNSVGYRLALINEHLPTDPRVKVVTDMGIPRPISDNAHFCGIGCLNRWLNKKYPEIVKRHRRMEEQGDQADQDT